MATMTAATTTGPSNTAYQFWEGQRLRSTRACPLALDLETKLIQDERQVPRLALAAASDGKTHVSLSQDNNKSEEAAEHSRANWDKMLSGLKEVAEAQA